LTGTREGARLVCPHVPLKHPSLLWFLCFAWQNSTALHCVAVDGKWKP
jgi:hypothetical protein